MYYWRYRVTLDITWYLSEYDLTLMRASSSAGETQGFLCRNRAFSCVMLSFWLLSKGCSSAQKARLPHTRYITTTTNTVTTVFHFMTECRADPSAAASIPVTMLAERDEMERRGRTQWPFAFTSQPIGFCMTATLAWTRLDWTAPDWTFFGGMMFVWTATKNRQRQIN